MNDITHYKEYLLEAIVRKIAKEVKCMSNKELVKKPILMENEFIKEAIIHSWMSAGVVTVLRQTKKEDMPCGFISELYKTADLFFKKVDLTVLYKAIKQDILCKKAKRKGLTIDIGDNNIKAIINSVLDAEKIL
jgi:hypothetical protein